MVPIKVKIYSKVKQKNVSSSNEFNDEGGDRAMCIKIRFLSIGGGEKYGYVKGVGDGKEEECKENENKNAKKKKSANNEEEEEEECKEQ